MRINKLKAVIADAQNHRRIQTKDRFCTDSEQSGAEERQEWHEDDLYHRFRKRS